MSRGNELDTSSKPFVSLAVAVNEEGEHLLIKRARDPHKDGWSLIGGVGASKKGLSPEEAVQDEITYDIGTELLDAELIFDYPLDNVDYADRVYVFLGRVAQEAIRLNPEAATELKWFSDQDIESEEIAFNGRWVIEEVGKRQGKQ